MVRLIHGICVHNLETVGVRKTVERLSVNLEHYDFKTGDQSRSTLVRWDRKQKNSRRKRGCEIKETINVWIYDEFLTHIWFKLQKLNPLSLKQQTLHCLARQFILSQTGESTLDIRKPNFICFPDRVLKCPTDEQLRKLIPVNNPLLLKLFHDAFDLTMCQIYHRKGVSGGVEYLGLIFGHVKKFNIWTNHNIE